MPKNEPYLCFWTLFGRMTRFDYFPTICYVQRDLWKNKNILRYPPFKDLTVECGSDARKEERTEGRKSKKVGAIMIWEVWHLWWETFLLHCLDTGLLQHRCANSNFATFLDWMFCAFYAHLTRTSDISTSIVDYKIITYQVNCISYVWKVYCC